MEAKHAMECGQWNALLDPAAAEAIAAAIDDLGQLPVLDATVLRIVGLCDDPDATAADLVAELETDAPFAANILAFANSAACATPVRANSIRQAVMLVGRRALRRLALETATYRFLERAAGNGSASRGQLHVHAITVSLCAAGAAEGAGLRGDSVHLAGLLHDVGKLVLPAAFGQAACDEIAAEHSCGVARAQAERERFGIDHAQAGALLALRWGMTAEVADLIAWHHGGQTGIAVPSPEHGCVQLGDMLAAMLCGDQPDPELLVAALEKTRLDPTALDRLAERAMPSGGRTDPALARRVAELEHEARTDELTQLPNRRAWFAAVRSALMASEPGSVLLIDVDHFKAVNDRHGHAAGDLVLTRIARVLERQGEAGRIGGDEFAIWVPGTPELGQIAANHVVALVSESFEAGSGPKVDVSIGVSYAGAGGDLAALLEAADGALLDAKRAGRSRAVLAA